MYKQAIIVVVLLSLFQLSCTAADNELLPILNKNAFDGFTITPNEIYLKGYNYKNHDRKIITFDSCKKTLDYNISDIAGHDYFRFKLLRVACKAINKYRSVKNSEKSFFPVKFDEGFYKNLPALTTPFLSKTEYKRRENITIGQAYKILNVTLKNNTATLNTKDDEIYITILARGDFNNDKIEDLLVSSEWYAKHANGKHTELVVLIKLEKNKSVQIDWRMNILREIK